MLWEVHLKKVICLFFILFICMWPVTSESAQVYLSCRPSLFVEGTIQPAMNTDILSSSYDDATGLMEITLNNWGTAATGVPGYKYSDARQFMPGTRITLQMDCGANHRRKILNGFPCGVLPLLRERASNNFCTYASFQCVMITSTAIQTHPSRNFPSSIPDLSAKFPLTYKILMPYAPIVKKGNSY